MYYLLFEAWAKLFGFVFNNTTFRVEWGGSEVYALVNDWFTLQTNTPINPTEYKNLGFQAIPGFHTLSGLNSSLIYLNLNNIYSTAPQQALLGAQIMTHISLWLIAIICVVFIYSLFRLVSRAFSGRR